MAYSMDSETDGGEVRLHQSQMSFFAATAKVVVAVAGIRGGKTHVGALKTLLYALQHPCAEDEMHLVCAPTYPMSRVPVEKLFRLLYDKSIFPVCPLVRYVKSERTFVLRADGGTTRIRVFSLHEPNRIRGVKALSAWLDEGAYVTSEAWDIVRGRLADTDGPCWITTTPAGHNFIHGLYEDALEERDAGVPLEARNVRFVHWRSTANTFIAAAGFARLSESLDARTYAQEVDAQFVKMAGLVYYPFSRQRHVRPAAIDKRLPLFVGQDFNVTKMASSFLQPAHQSLASDGLHVVDERLASDTNTFDLLRYLDRYCADNGIPKENVTIFPDASGASRSTAGKSDHQILKDGHYRVKAPAKNPFVKDRINCVNGLLSPMVGRPRLYVAPHCSHHIETFEQQTYREDSDPPEPDKAHGKDHMADAVGYPCVYKFPVRQLISVGGKRAA